MKTYTQSFRIPPLRSVMLGACILGLAGCSELSVNDLNDETDASSSIQHSVLGQAHPAIAMGNHHDGIQRVYISATYASSAPRQYTLTNTPQTWTVIDHQTRGNDRCGFKSCPYIEHFVVDIPSSAVRTMEDHAYTLTMRTQDMRNDTMTIEPADIRQALAYTRIHGPAQDPMITPPPPPGAS